MTQAPIRLAGHASARPTRGPATITPNTKRLDAVDSGTCAPACAAPCTIEMTRCRRTAAISHGQGDCLKLLMPLEEEDQPDVTVDVHGVMMVVIAPVRG